MQQKQGVPVKLRIPAGQASPAPPVGPALGQKGVNIMKFCQAFNERTRDQKGRVIPVVITVYPDRSFTFVTKTPPVSHLLLEAAHIKKGSGKPNQEKVGQVTQKQVEDIAKIKIVDSNASNTEALMRCIEGTALSMGLTVVKA